MSTVADLRSEVTEMQSRALVCRTLMGGTQAMRAAGRTYLPQWAMEKDDAWEARRDSTVLFNAFSDAVDAMVGKPLGEPVVVEDVPAVIEGSLENVDYTGRDLDTFCREWFEAGLVDGISWVVADYPRVPAGATLAQERAMGARPYLIHVPLANVLGWRSQIINGQNRLTEFRYLESTEVQDGEWGVSTVQRVRVLRPGEVWVFEQSDSGWILVPDLSGPVTLREMPVVTFAPGRVGFMTALPPLEDLAWLNVRHWQSCSDQIVALHVARVPLLFGSGFGSEDKLVVGPSNAILGPEGSDFKFVEHSGRAIDAGRQDLQDLQEQMRLMAGKVLSRQAGGDKSATEAGIEARDGGSKLRQWTWSFQDAVEEALRLMATWIGEKSGGTATVSTDWDDLPDPTLFQTVLQARQAGEISRDTWLWNAARYGVLPPGRTAEEEKSALELEGPSPLSMQE